MTANLPILYRVAEGGPFDIQVDNGVTIENITDDLVNAKILIPDSRLQAIADAWNSIGFANRVNIRTDCSVLGSRLDVLTDGGCGCEAEHLGPDGYGCKLNESGVSANEDKDDSQI